MEQAPNFPYVKSLKNKIAPQVLLALTFSHPVEQQDQVCLDTTGKK